MSNADIRRFMTHTGIFQLCYRILELKICQWTCNALGLITHLFILMFEILLYAMATELILFKVAVKDRTGDASATGTSVYSSLEPLIAGE